MRSCRQAKRSAVRYPICLRGRRRRSAEEEAAEEQAQRQGGGRQADGPVPVGAGDDRVVEMAEALGPDPLSGGDRSGRAGVHAVAWLVPYFIGFIRTGGPFYLPGPWRR